MTVFTPKEKMIFRFLLVAIIVGLFTGLLRKKYFNPDFSQEIVAEVEQFHSANEKINEMEKVNQQNFTTISDESSSNNSLKSININTASKSDLMTLPTIGPVTAERIIRYREDFGTFQVIDDLLKVKGIGVKTLEKIKPLISFN